MGRTVKSQSISYAGKHGIWINLVQIVTDRSAVVVHMHRLGVLTIQVEMWTVGAIISVALRFA